MIVNGRFLVPGAFPGQADQWLVSTATSGGAVADFSGGVGAPASVEAFIPGWNNDAYVTSNAGGTTALFDSSIVSPPAAVETFERWKAATYLTTIGGGVAAQFGGSPVEVFTPGWDNDTYLETFVGVSLFSETFSPWQPTYLTTFVGLAADFRIPGGLVNVETFEYLVPDVVFAALPDLDYCFAPGHPLVQDLPMYVETTGVRPSPLAQNVLYYVLVVDVDNFALSLTASGPAVNLTDFGLGEHRVTIDKRYYWTGGFTDG